MPTDTKRVFISYSHRQEDWVFDRLVPCLKAGGVDVLIDRERFAAGRAVVGQMDAVQDEAQINVLVFSPEYLASPFCTHEMTRAIATDPTFIRGIVIPVVRADCSLPYGITTLNPLYVDLRDDKNPNAWQILLTACFAQLGTDAVHWLATRDELIQHLERDCSVNLLVAGNNVAWMGMIHDLASRSTIVLTRVDLHDARTIDRHGLLGCMLSEDGAGGAIAQGSDDLAEFQRTILARPAVTRVAILHFDVVEYRSYGIDYLTTMRYLTTEARKLVLLIQSHAPLTNLLRPEWQNIMSQIVPPVVELRARR